VVDDVNHFNYRIKPAFCRFTAMCSLTDGEFRQRRNDVGTEAVLDV